MANVYLTEYFLPFSERSKALLAFIIVSIVFANFPAPAQEILGIHPTGGSIGELPSFLPGQLAPAPPGKVLPRFLPAPREKGQQIPILQVFIRRVNVTGNTVFTDSALAEITAPYTNRAITSEDLEQLRIDLTNYYVQRGYVTSGAYIPDQTVDDGVIEFHIIEGKLTNVEVEGNAWFDDRYIQDRFYLDSGPPVSILALQKRLQLLEQHQGIHRLHAELRPSLNLGEDLLNVRITENIPYKVLFEFNNHQSPTVGAERGILKLSHENMFGVSDVLSASAGISEGVHAQIDVSYSVPFTVQDTTLLLAYGRDDFSAVEEPFDPLDIESETETFTVGLRHPLYRTLNDTLTLALTGERLRNETSLLGSGFQLSPGANINGKSVVTAIRFSQEWIHRSLNHVVAINSRFTLGIDTLGATNNESGVADSQYLSWLGQFQWVRRESRSGAQLILRTDIQLANDSLLSVEQIALGGRHTVRGYRENQLVRDNAIISSFETRIPVVRDKQWADSLELIPFFDWGRGWNTETSTPTPKTIASMGVGLRWTVTLPFRYPIKPEFEIFWGHDMKDTKTEGGDLQDDGIHLRFSLGNI